jgi:hypothetical protein
MLEVEFLSAAKRRSVSGEERVESEEVGSEVDLVASVRPTSDSRCIR